MPAPKNPVVKFKPCRRCDVAMQYPGNGTRFYCDGCLRIVRKERGKRRAQKQSQQKLKAWEEKGPGICEMCRGEFKRNRNDMKRFCDTCLIDRRRAKDRQKQRAERKTPEYKARYRDYMLRKNYGVSAEQVDSMFAAQGNCCAICKSLTPNGGRGWHVDHCHQTGAVRGILCQKCNLMIGLAMDSPTTLASAVQYLLRATLPISARAYLVKAS